MRVRLTQNNDDEEPIGTVYGYYRTRMYTPKRSTNEMKIGKKKQNQRVFMCILNTDYVPFMLSYYFYFMYLTVIRYWLSTLNAIHNRLFPFSVHLPHTPFSSPSVHSKHNVSFIEWIVLQILFVLFLGRSSYDNSVYLRNCFLWLCMILTMKKKK